MTFAKIWIQVKTKWENIHIEETAEVKALRARLIKLEDFVRAHNLDPNVDVDSQSS